MIDPITRLLVAAGPLFYGNALTDLVREGVIAVLLSRRDTGIDGFAGGRRDRLAP